MVKFKDTDFLHASARIKSLENKMLTSRQLAQMVDAHNNDEAFKIANDAGIGVGTEIADYEESLKDNLLETYELLEGLSGGTGVFSIFRYESDGLNLKTMIKAQALGKEPSSGMTDLGTVPAARLREQFQKEKIDTLPKTLVDASAAALDVLARTGDPQLVDVIIDKAVLETMQEKASGYDNKFLRALIAAKIDISNIRCMVRMSRIGSENDFFRRVVAPGGTISETALIEAYQKGTESVIAFIEASQYGPALEQGLSALRTGGSLTLFEKLCDNYMVRLLDSARLKPFGLEPLIVYLMAKENEIKAVRIVLASRLAGVAPDQIKERLRESYA